ncbi:MAG: sulfite exporter TauE/SafE family protein [Chloroflexi bacterium]|nr:sulfite exporter TauE/SafE family protein [Chloroflexota bacterium]
MAEATPVDLRRHWPAAAAIGGAAGLLSGLLGIGGAAILVPGMVDILGMSQHRAAGTSLLAMLPTAAVAAIVYAQGDQTSWPLIVLFSITAVAGASIGARVSSRLPGLVLRRIFGVCLLLIALRLLVPGGASEADAISVDLFAQATEITAGEGLLGLVAGFLSGLLGIGGAQILTPGMVYLFAIPQKVAQGISVACIVPTAIAGAYQHYRQGNVDTRVGLVLIPTSIAAGALGAAFVHLVDAPTLRFGFGIFLVYAGTRMLAPRLWTGLFRRLRP